MSVESALQVAIFQRLSTETAHPIKDNVSDAPETPFIAIGDFTINEASTSCGDGFDIDARIRCVGTSRSRKQTQDMGSEVMAAMKARLAPSGYRVTVQYFEQSVTQSVEKGLRFMNILTFRILLRPLG